MLDPILTALAEPHTLPNLHHHLASIAANLLQKQNPDARPLVRSTEELVRRAPAQHFTFDATGIATLHAGARSWSAGSFETVSIGTLRQRVAARDGSGTGKARLIVFDGASALTDIATLQATSGPHTLFQVASQFNCLESPGPHITEVSNYFDDPTQGPRASLSAFPATLLRHYAAPRADGTRYEQRNDGEQIDLLTRACGRRVSRNGYLTGEGHSPSFLAQSLHDHFDAIEIGLHRDAEVVLGHNGDGAVEGRPHIAQAFTSTVAGGAYGASRILGPHFEPIAATLLRAAYTATLLGAISLDCTRVVLTMIGGGVFANPPMLIWQAILDAFDEVRPFVSSDFDVVLNGRQLPPDLDLENVIRPEVQTRDGAIVKLERDSAIVIR